MKDLIVNMLRYKSWANDRTFEDLAALPPEELTRPRQTNFGTILSTLNHILVVDDIFRHHLEGRPHGYSARNTEETPPLAEIVARQREMDAWYLSTTEACGPAAFDQGIDFTFVGGGDGHMSRGEIFLHVVNHATYHRGFISDMMYQVPARPSANDLPVYLREHPQGTQT